MNVLFQNELRRTRHRKQKGLCSFNLQITARVSTAYIYIYICVCVYRNAQIGFTSRGLIDVYMAIASMVERNPIRQAIRESRSSDASFVESLLFPSSLSHHVLLVRRLFFSFLTDRGIIPTRLLSGLSSRANIRKTILIRQSYIRLNVSNL